MVNAIEKNKGGKRKEMGKVVKLNKVGKKGLTEFHSGLADLK